MWKQYKNIQDDSALRCNLYTRTSSVLHFTHRILQFTAGTQISSLPERLITDFQTSADRYEHYWHWFIFFHSKATATINPLASHHTPSQEKSRVVNYSSVTVGWAEIETTLRAQLSMLRCCWVIDFSPLMFSPVERPLTSQTDDADSWLRDGLGQTPLLTSKLWFTGQQRHIAKHHLHTCEEEAPITKHCPNTHTRVRTHTGIMFTHYRIHAGGTEWLLVRPGRTWLE